MSIKAVKPFSHDYTFSGLGELALPLCHAQAEQLITLEHKKSWRG